ncbi:hypothetical protein [Streptomyces sp. NRRL F-5126]|uniref:hypothetical protein n=1 Tax=Streptomyces sp. NRRL F-5126 TaxID=1463857 RepID=UPI000B0FEFA9|nr:hypothetical protein [Streptomyces sp. NRRL F-5126]
MAKSTRARATGHSAAGQWAGGGHGRRSPGLTRFAGGLLILLSLALAAGSYVVFTQWLPYDGARYQDYRAALPCRVQPHRPRQECLSTWHLTVVEAVTKHNGEGNTYRATLRRRHSWRGEVYFGGSEPLFDRLKAGDRVTATAWRGQIMVLGKDGVRQNTSDVPHEGLQVDAAVGTFAGLLAAEAFAFGAVRLLRPRSPLFAWRPYGARTLSAIFTGCAVVGLLAVATGAPWWAVPPAVTVVAALALAALLRRARRRVPAPGA